MLQGRYEKHFIYMGGTGVWGTWKGKERNRCYKIYNDKAEKQVESMEAIEKVETINRDV